MEDDIYLSLLRSIRLDPESLRADAAARGPVSLPPERSDKPEICGHCAQNFHPWNPRHVEHHARAHHRPMTRSMSGRRRR